MGLMFGGKRVAPVVTKEVAKTKFGASVDMFIGDVDENGKYVEPQQLGNIVFTGLKEVGYGAFFRAFNLKHNGHISFPDLKQITGNSGYCFGYAFSGSESTVIEFNSLEEIDCESAFYYATCPEEGALLYGDKQTQIYFPVLKKAYGRHVLSTLWTSRIQAWDEVLPALEEVSGDSALRWSLAGSATHAVFTNMKKVVGGTSKGAATFYSGTYSPSYSEHYLKLPRVTDVSKYLCNTASGSYKYILHFAVANQAAIEACSGYEYMFGANEIRFDLILKITVDGIEYDRGLVVRKPGETDILDVYVRTEWKSDNNNIVYTDGYGEPAVGTIVYSDPECATQVGTVSGVA